MQRNYNDIYSKLVGNEMDVLGHIAYSLYKENKIEYIEKQELRGYCVTDQDLVPFNHFSSSDSTVHNYKIRAELILQEFVDNMLLEELKDYDVQLTHRQTEILKDIIAPLRPSFWNNIVIGVISSFVFTLLIVFLTIITEHKDSAIHITVGKMHLPSETNK